MKALFIGGTGEISAACSQRAVELGIDLQLLTRGRGGTRPAPEGAELLRADIRDPAAARAAIGTREFDVVVDFVAFTPEQVQADVELFRGRTGQYVFISSASAIRRRRAVCRWWSRRRCATRSGPTRRPRSPARSCSSAPTATMRSRPRSCARRTPTTGRACPTTAAGRWSTGCAAAKRFVVHGDGTSLWTLTHSDDFAKGFVGLLGHPQAIGDSFHITSDEVLTWNTIHELLAAAAGAEPRIVHVPSDAIIAVDEEWGRSLLGDKAHSMVFDNSKIRTVVPDYLATIPFWQGARAIVAWHDEDPSRRVVDPRMDELLDRLVEEHRPSGLSRA